jgi:hypothetical protein
MVIRIIKRRQLEYYLVTTKNIVTFPYRVKGENLHNALECAQTKFEENEKFISIKRIYSSKRRLYSKLWMKINKERVKLYQKKYREENIDRIKKRDIKYYQNHKNMVNDRMKIKYNNDERIRTSQLLRCKLRQILKGDIVDDKYSYELCGCSIKYLKEYLQLKFIETMSWNNYGEWQIDHITPVKWFELQEKSEQKRCFHYSNLQPLWIKDNQDKGVKCDL